MLKKASRNKDAAPDVPADDPVGTMERYNEAYAASCWRPRLSPLSLGLNVARRSADRAFWFLKSFSEMTHEDANV